MKNSRLKLNLIAILLKINGLSFIINKEQTNITFIETTQQAYPSCDKPLEHRRYLRAFQAKDSFSLLNLHLSA